MGNFRTLDLAVEFYELAEKENVTGHLRDQLLRAASSIALNLAEGNAKASANEKRHFFQTAYGSLRECQTIFKLLKTESDEALKMADQLGANLYKLVNSEIKPSPSWRKSPNPSDI
jgi:four helix bundle protein